MSENYYQVILTGDSEHDESQAAATLANIFDKSETQMRRLLELTPIAIRKGVDQQTAEEYQTVLIEQGMGVKLESSSEAAAVSVPVANQTPVDEDVSENDDATHLSWSLEPTDDEASPTTGKASFSIDEEGIEQLNRKK